jgi:hypothetical protein
MGFLDFFREDNKNNNAILSVEEDDGVDYLDKISNEVLNQRDSETKEPVMVETVVEVPDNKVELIIKSSGLSREKIDEFYPKMKDAPGSAKRMLESVLDMMGDDEKRNRNPEVLIGILGKKLSPESLAKIASAMIILAEENILEEVLGVGTEGIISGGTLSEKLKSANIESSPIG